MTTPAPAQAARTPTSDTMRDVAQALVRATTAAGLLPLTHPAVRGAVASLCDALRAHGATVTLGISSIGLRDRSAALLEKEASEVSRRLHAMQFGTLELTVPADDESIGAGIACLTSAWSESAEAFASALAARSNGAMRLHAARMDALRAEEGGHDASSPEHEHEGTLLIRAILAGGAGGLTPDALASTINASLATQNPEQIAAWRTRLNTAMDLLATSDKAASEEGRARIAKAIASLEPQVRSLLTSPPVLSAEAARNEHARRATEAEQMRALKLLHAAHEQGAVRAPDVLSTIERATSEGVLSPEAVMLCAKLCTLTRTDHTQASRSDAALHALHSGIERVLRDPAVHGYTPEDYRRRLGTLARRSMRAENVPTFAGRSIDPRVQAACIAASIVQQADELGFDATGSLRFLTKRVGAMVSSESAAPLAALAHTLACLPTGPEAPTGATATQQTIVVAARELRAALSETSCLMPLVKRAGGESDAHAGVGSDNAGASTPTTGSTECTHALAILAALPELPVTPLAQQFAMNGAAGLRRTLDVRLRSMPVEHVIELTHAMVAQSGITPHLLTLLEGLDPTRAHAAMCDLLAQTPASERRRVFEALVRTGAAMPPGLLATALVDEDAAIVAMAVQQLQRLDARAGAFTVHAALVHLDGTKRLSAARVKMLIGSAIGLSPHGPHALASLLDAWRWTLTGARPRACSLIAEALMPVAQYDDAVREIVRSWMRSSGRLVNWLFSSEEGA